MTDPSKQNVFITTRLLVKNKLSVHRCGTRNTGVRVSKSQVNNLSIIYGVQTRYINDPGYKEKEKNKKSSDGHYSREVHIPISETRTVDHGILGT